MNEFAHPLVTLVDTMDDAADKAAQRFISANNQGAPAKALDYYGLAAVRAKGEQMYQRAREMEILPMELQTQVEIMMEVHRTEIMGIAVTQY